MLGTPCNEQISRSAALFEQYIILVCRVSYQKLLKTQLFATFSFVFLHNTKTKIFARCLVPTTETAPSIMGGRISDDSVMRKVSLLLGLLDKANSVRSGFMSVSKRYVGCIPSLALTAYEAVKNVFRRCYQS